MCPLKLPIHTAHNLLGRSGGSAGTSQTGWRGHPCTWQGHTWSRVKGVIFKQGGVNRKFVVSTRQTVTPRTRLSRAPPCPQPSPAASRAAAPSAWTSSGAAQAWAGGRSLDPQPLSLGQILREGTPPKDGVPIPQDPVVPVRHLPGTGTAARWHPWGARLSNPLCREKEAWGALSLCRGQGSLGP